MYAWLHTAQTPEWIFGGCSQFNGQSAWWNKQDGTCILLTQMWAGILMRPPPATSRCRHTHNELQWAATTRHRGYVAQKPERWGRDQTVVSVLPLKVKEHLIMCCGLWQCVYVCVQESCWHNAVSVYSDSSGCLWEDLGRPCGHVLSAVKTSFKNTRHHKNNHCLNCINTHTVAPRSRSAAGTKNPAISVPASTRYSGRISLHL